MCLVIRINKVLFSLPGSQESPKWMLVRISLLNQINGATLFKIGNDKALAVRIYSSFSKSVDQC
jgi:hypothetical protein